ncbi:MAG: hypothetical protein NW207_07905 [Cytophagales bacterium]|nr:hypothetical protein [Cytophagales bacterium]
MNDLQIFDNEIMTIADDSHSKSDAIAKILYLLHHDVPGLTQILYRIDVSENKINEAFALHEDLLIAERIYELILARLKQKIEFRQKYSKYHTIT